jgi:Arc/MetJ family transcription regulator
MKKTLHIDDALLAEARAASGATTDTEAVRLGLEALVRHAAYERLRRLRGSEPGAKNVPRRRERAARKRGAAA